MEERGATLEELVTVVSGQRYKQALESGDLNVGVFYSGQCIGLIHDVPSVEELISRIMSEAEEVRRRLNAMQ